MEETSIQKRVKRFNHMKEWHRMSKFHIFFKLCCAAAGIILLWSAAGFSETVQSGKEIWQVNLEDPVTALAKVSDLSDDGFSDVIAGTEGDMVFCVESRTGELWWTSATRGTV